MMAQNTGKFIQIDTGGTFAEGIKSGNVFATDADSRFVIRNEKYCMLRQSNRGENHN